LSRSIIIYHEILIDRTIKYSSWKNWLLWHDIYI